MLKKIPADNSFTFLGETIPPVQNAKDLGLIMDSNLSFDKHIKQSVSSCMKKLHQINMIKNLFKRSTLEMTIQSQVFPKLFYFSTFWPSTSLKNICQLQTVHGCTHNDRFS